MTKLERLLRTLWAYNATRQSHFQSRAHLEACQRKELAAHLKWVSQNSPLYRQSLDASTSEGRLELLSQLPVIGKSEWLAGFDQSNTAGLKLSQVMSVALQAEQERQFRPVLNGCTVGLSSGTSGERGAFVVSEAEQARWAGVILAKLLPDNLFTGQKVAFFLRANSNLYTSVSTPWLTFEYFDLLKPFAAHLDALKVYQPTIVVAPAQVLLAIAQSGVPLLGVTAISVAEVLDPTTRHQLSARFEEVREVYQATEGLLATTCAHGALHLNEEHVFFEMEELGSNRVVPVITDFSRKTQPLLRYRLNDVLRLNRSQCTCGLFTRTIAAIEGRCDDQLQLPRSGAVGTVTVFADAISRVLAYRLPLAADYQLEQVGPQNLRLSAAATTDQLENARQGLESLFGEYGVCSSQLQWETIPHWRADKTFDVKRRRIRNLVPNPKLVSRETFSEHTPPV